ncbi:unnamed protein product [Rotaria magnacalcarata]|uniref:F-box domain-containing protein n=2 Tax=Rotaria magnacalcarata TaxID=392030 RepID=A0A816WPY8_9BILA|nr:unnamed protein product [Rotaria magnacalcarata]
MDTQTHLEDLANEIFFELFDYLHALDIFTAFASLNKRISSILRSIPLRIVISKTHCRNQIDFLSSHLTLHIHQVISIKISDTIRDDASIISLLFSRHNFINLQFCRLTTIDRSTKLDNVIKQIKTFDKLVSLNIFNLTEKTMNAVDKCELTQTMLMHQSSSLRLIALRYGCDYFNISDYISLPPNVTSLHLYIAGLSAIVSVRSVIALIRLCHRVRSLHIILKDTSSIDDTDIYDPITIPTLNENDIPVLSQVISFGFILFTAWNNDSIAFILRCMPNLKYFFFTFGPCASQNLFPVELLDGYVWQEMLEVYVPYLSKFEFHMSIWKCFSPTDLNIVIDSFKNFVGKFSNWHMVIDQWRLQCESSGEYLVLRTLNYHKYKWIINIFMPAIHSGYFDTRSTMEIEDDHYLFYVNELDLNIYIASERSPIPCSSPLFQQVKCFKLELPIVPSSLSNSLLDIVNFHQISDDDAQETVGVGV